MGAEEKIEVLEADLFAQLVAYLRDYIQAIQMNGHVLAQIDCLINFAYLAEKHNYVRPNINEDLIIDIKDGRHPVIENQLPVEESYVPNDVYLDNESQQIIMITGPNMSGKSAVPNGINSTYMAQWKFYCLLKMLQMAWRQINFYPVGANDNISSGESLLW
ncbi:MAG: hypothetical protein R2777_01355 [Chitinophagales bacterium]